MLQVHWRCTLILKTRTPLHVYINNTYIYIYIYIHDVLTRSGGGFQWIFKRSLWFMLKALDIQKKRFLCNMVSNLLDQDTQRASHIMDTPWQCDDSVLQTVTYYYMDLTRDVL